MKKTFFLFILIAVFSNAFGAGTAQDFYVSPFSYRITSATTVAVCHGEWVETGWTSVMIIPETIKNTEVGKPGYGNTYTITSIDAKTFSAVSWNDPVVPTSITMPNTITTLGTEVFTNSPKLKSVTLSSSLKALPYNTFNSCTSLTSITLPASIDSLGQYVFTSCSSLTKMRCENPIPPKCSRISFPLVGIGYVTSAITFSVPYASLTAYKTATTWNLFNAYQFTTITAIETPIESDYLIKTSDKTIEMSNVSGKSIKVFDLSGRIVFETHNSQETEQFTVSNKGIYVISIDNFRKKIAIY